MVYGERDDRGVADLAGYQVYDRHYEKIGKVDDLFVSESGQSQYIGVKLGLLGTKSTLIPIEVVRVNDRRQLVEVAVDKDAVKEGPMFGDDREITPEFERRVLGYYGVQTARPEQAPSEHYPDPAGDERVDLRPGERAEAQRRVDQREARHTESSGYPGERDQGAIVGGVDRERGGRLGDEPRIQRSEEESRAGTRERDAGGVNVRKRVRTDREEVHAERAPVEEREGSETGNREVPGGKGGEEEIRIPIIEEEIVVEKRPVVREEIRIRKNVVEEEEVVEADVRKEEVDIDNPSTSRDG